MSSQRAKSSASIQCNETDVDQGQVTDAVPATQQRSAASASTPGCDYCTDLVLYGSNEACPQCGTVGPLNMWPMAGHPEPQWDTASSSC